MEGSGTSSLIRPCEPTWASTGRARRRSMVGGALGGGVAPGPIYLGASPPHFTLHWYVPPRDRHRIGLDSLISHSPLFRG